MLFIILFVPLLSSVLTLILILIERALTVCFVSHNNDRIKQFMRVNINNKGRKEARKEDLTTNYTGFTRKWSFSKGNYHFFERIQLSISQSFLSVLRYIYTFFWVTSSVIYSTSTIIVLIIIIIIITECACEKRERERSQWAWVVYALSAIQNYLQSQSKYKSRRIFDA